MNGADNTLQLRNKENKKSSPENHREKKKEGQSAAVEKGERWCNPTRWNPKGISRGMDIIKRDQKRPVDPNSLISVRVGVSRKLGGRRRD